VASTSAQKPKIFGPYKLLERIATGGSAEIFLACAVEDGAAPPGLVVVKRLRGDRCTERQLRDAFVDEGKLLGELKHRCIVELLDLGDVEGRPFLVLEHVWGETLDTLTWLCSERGKQFSVNAALHIGVEVASALAYAHERCDAQGVPSPVIHRDVTFGNVMISYDGRVKLLDYGIAKADDRVARTRAGQVKGTMFYVSPEQLRGEQAGPATDTYQLGILLYKLMVGREPVSDGPQEQIMRAIVAGALIPPSVAVPGFPTLIEAVLLKATAREPKDRFASARELAVALRKLLGARSGQGQQLLARMMSYLGEDRYEQQRACINNHLMGFDTETDLSRYFKRHRLKGEPSTIDVDLARLLRKVDMLSLATSGDDVSSAKVLERLLEEAERVYAGGREQPASPADEEDEQVWSREPTSVSASTYINTAWESPPKHGTDTGERSGSDGGPIISTGGGGSSGSGPMLLGEQLPRPLTNPAQRAISGQASAVKTIVDDKPPAFMELSEPKTLPPLSPPPAETSPKPKPEVSADEMAPIDALSTGDFEKVPPTLAEFEPLPDTVSDEFAAVITHPVSRMIPVLCVRNGRATALFPALESEEGAKDADQRPASSSSARSGKPQAGSGSWARDDTQLDD